MKLTIRIKDEEKGTHLIQLLQDLDFIEIEKNIPEKAYPFFQNISGVWKNSQITLEELRKKAWKR